jgi:hypothetical protein
MIAGIDRHRIFHPSAAIVTEECSHVEQMRFHRLPGVSCVPGDYPG